MRIKTQFILTLIFFSAILLIIVVFSLTTNQKTAHLNRQIEIALNVERGAGDLGYLSNEYLLYREKQQKERWESRYSALVEDVSRLNLDDPEQAGIVDNIKANCGRLHTVFSSIISAFDSMPSMADAHTSTGLQVSWSRMAVQSQGMVFDAKQLTQALHRQADRLRYTTYTMILALIVLFSMFLLFYYLLFYRRMLRSLAIMQQGTKAIGAGDLDYQIKVKYRDEVGDLAQAFNKMTAGLKESIATNDIFRKEIAERKRAEDALKKSERTYRLLVNSIPNTSIMLFDKNLRFQVVGGQENEKNNLEKSTIEGKTLREAYPKDIADLFEPIYQKALLGDPTSFEMSYGQFAYLQQTIPVKDTEGGILNAMQISTNITESKKAEKALKESEEKFRRIVETASEGIVVGDADGKIDFVNKRMADMLGYPVEEILGKIGLDFMPADQKETVLANRSKLAQKSQVQDEFCFLRKDGTLLWTIGSTSPVLNDKGGHIGNLAMHTDITERKRAGEQVRLDAEKLRRTNKELEFFNRAMVEREIRMVEMKKEINELCLKLGEQERYGMGAEKR